MNEKKRDLDGYFPRHRLSDQEIVKLKLKEEALDKIANLYYNEKEEIFSNEFVEELGYILEDYRRFFQ